MFSPCQRFFLALLLSTPALFSCSGGSSSDSTSDGGSAGICHNGTIDPGDQCDNSVTDSTNCRTLGFADGDLHCDNDCQFDTSACTPLTTCGNGTLDTLELCEGFELRNATCSSQGFKGGSLACTDDCTIDTSNCFQAPQTSCGGEVPSATGEFFLALAPSIAPAALLQFIATVLVDSSSTPATLTMSLQPLCTQSEQCTVGQPVGSSHAAGAIELDEQCLFTINISAIEVPGGANTISGATLTADLTIAGDLQTDDFYCGGVNGTATVEGTPVPLDNSTFGAKRIDPGTLGGALPPPVPTCP